MQEYLQSAGSFARVCAKRVLSGVFNPLDRSLESHALKKHVWEHVLQSCKLLESAGMVRALAG